VNKKQTHNERMKEIAEVLLDILKQEGITCVEGAHVAEILLISLLIGGEMPLDKGLLALKETANRYRETFES